MKTRYAVRVSSLAMLLSMVLTFAFPVFNVGTSSQALAVTNTVTLVGDLQSEAGCATDNMPTCTVTRMVAGAGDGIYRITLNLIPGTYGYKVVINEGAESYGQGGVLGGANTVLTVPTTPGSPTTAVRFYYSDTTHWNTSNLNARIMTATGSFQSEAGCANDWTPSCLKSWLQDLDGDGTYTWETTNVPIGNNGTKAVANEDNSYAEAYPVNDLLFTVPASGYLVRFTFVSSTNSYSVDVINTGVSCSVDNNIIYDRLGHNSQDLIYRQPFGAVNPNTTIKLRFRTCANDVNTVQVRFYDTTAGQEFLINMARTVRDISCYDVTLGNARCDWWEASFVPTNITTLYYRFIVSDGTSTAYYADDNYKDGGLGQGTPNLIDNSYVVTVFDPAFQPISWMKNAVIYQIFPDRFRNGNTANDPSPTEPRYRYPGTGPGAADDQILNYAWDTLPEGYCRKYVNPAVQCLDTPKGRDYYGGDLAGVTEKLEYLHQLGVNVIYFNPIFEAGSNHLYDTQDYRKIDHFFGTNADWKKLVAEAKLRNMRIVLDGVFNHVSSDSSYFDRYSHFPDVGACESLSSPYRSWFFFQPLAGGPCAGPNGANTMTYEAWFGFDSLPVLNKNNTSVQQLFNGTDNGVAKYWLKQGAAGWRLDVMGDGSFPDSFWKEFRTTVKSTNPDAIIIGELWKKEEILPKIHGDMADTTMNYRFRNAILGFFGTVDDKGFLDDGQSDQSPTLFARKLDSLREDYPDATYYTIMNIMDSHDTSRILWSLTPGERNREAKELNAANLAIGKKRLKLATLVQMTMPGAPTIYYGDEVALNGDDDPDDRRTFPWISNFPKPGVRAGGDQAMLGHYANLIQARKTNPELVNGALKFLLLDDANRTMAYAMRDATGRTSIVAVNRSETASRTVDIPLTGYLRNGVFFKDQIGGGNVTTANGKLTLTLPPLTGALYTSGGTQDLVGPTTASALQVTPNNGNVALSWTNNSSDVVSYNVYRTQLSGGGYEFVANTTGLNFTDSGVVNGKRYHYVVRAVDALGNEGVASNELAASPAFPIEYAVLQFPKDITHTKGISATPTIYAQVYAPGLTTVAGNENDLLAQVGFGAGGTTPATWTTWANMSFNTRNGNNYEYQATLTPEVTGNFNMLVRFSANGGLSWTYGDRNGLGIITPGTLLVLPNADTEAPASPTNVRILDWSAGFIKIGWNGVADGAQYRIYRRTAAGTFDFNNPLAIVGAGVSEYRDAAVANGTTYFYTVRAYDAALNASVNSGETSQRAEPKVVQVTFKVKVPATTPISDVVYLVGNQPALGPWNPGLQPMNNMGNNVWQYTLGLVDGTLVEYKYTRGSWDRVEWWGTIVSFGNRQVSVSYGTDGTQLVDNTSTTGEDNQKAVENWRDPIVASTIPANGASGNAPTSVEVQFVRDIQTLQGSSDFSASVVVSRSGILINGTVAISGNNKLIWTPSTGLTAGTYTVTVNNVRSQLGGDSSTMQVPYVFTFTVSPAGLPNRPIIKR